jgi:mono/diheme cytochrome c family protein
LPDALKATPATKEIAMAKPFLLLSAAVLMWFAALPAPGKMPMGGGSGGQAAKTSAVRAKEIYKIDCAVCHGDNGNGQTDLAKSMQLTLKDWTDPKSLADSNDQQLFDIIRKGTDKMPPEDSGRAKDEEIKGLVQYIREFSKATSAASAAPNQTR